MQNLVDDRSTSDVLIYVHERNEQHLYRKRSIYVHSTILRARSSYFDDMLTAGWAETSGEDARARSVVKIEDFDFVRVFSCCVVDGAFG